GSLEQTAIPTFEEPGVSAAQSSLQPVTDGSSSLDKSCAVDDSDSLPPAVTEEVASVGSDDNQQRVVIESNVVDALLEGKADSADTKAIDDAVATENPETADETSSPLIKVVKPHQDMTQAPAQSEEG
ncbi:cell division protein DamX, partial [Vibrio parahaemolyticus]|nr:cell division protein DamX [Vibrio parahaemolyticus]